MSNYRDKEKQKATRAKWYQEHREEVIAKAKAWNEAHKDELNARRRKNKK